MIGVLLYGTEKKVNVRDFDHLSLILPLDVPEGKSIIKIEDMVTNQKDLEKDVGQLPPGSMAKVAIHEALWQCQALFNEVKGKSHMKKIILFTTNDDPHQSDAILKRQAAKKANDLGDTGIVFEVVPLGKDFDWSKFYGDMITKEDTEELSVPFNDTPSQKLEDLLRLVRKRVHKKRSTGRCHLDLGGGVKIAVATYNFVQRASKPSKVRLTRDTNEEVRLQRLFVDQNTGAPMLPSDISKFMEYGGKRIKFTQDEVRATQKSLMDGTSGLKLIAFKQRSDLKWCDFVRSSNFIYPDDNMVKGSRNLFSALLIKCLERDVVAICAYKAREISAPAYVALYPQKEELDPQDGAQKTPPGFLIVYLPFADDFRDVPEGLPLLQSDEDQVNAAKKVIKKLKMKVYNPEAFENPSLQSHYRLVESLALQRQDVEDEGQVDGTLPPFDIMKKRLGNLSQEFLDAAEPNEEALEMVEAHKRAIAEAKKRTAASSTRAAPAKKPKVELDTNGDMTLNMEKFVNEKKVASLTVALLKEFLRSVHCPVGNKKKTELVQDVYDHFQI